MDYMFKNGFLPTDAPLFMDEVTVVVAVLPLLVAFAISQAKKGKMELHKKLQLLIFVAGLLMVGYFEYGVRVMGNFAEVLKQSHLNQKFLYIFLAFHILVATITTIMWSFTVFHGLIKHKKLPTSEFRYTHIRYAKPTFLGITLTSVTGVLLYLFIYIF